MSAPASKRQKLAHAAAAANATVQRSEQGLCIVSFNIHDGFSDFDGKKCTFDATLRWLQSIKPDVVCFQEATWRFPKLTRAFVEAQLRQHVGLTYFAYGFASDIYSNGFYGQMTCSRLPISSSYTIMLEPHAESGEGRCALVTNLYANDFTILCTVINTHLDVWNKPGATRYKEAKQILDYLKVHGELRNGYPLPVLLCGDFNEARQQDFATTATWNNYKRAKGGRTIALLMDKGGAEDVTDRLGLRVTENTRPYEAPRIDFCFVIDPLALVRVDNAGFATDVDTSDHYPIVARLTISHPHSEQH